MRPLMSRFCVFYSLETGVICLCIASIFVSGGLICNHHFKIPVQIRDWRNITVYDDSQLDMLNLNTKIAIWVLASDILLTLLMLLPAALTDVATPWKKRNSVRKVLIPNVIGKILCTLHGIAGFVWIAWKFHRDCPEIIGILLALAVYILLGWYLIIVVISYYLELGMRRTFHKLVTSKNNSQRGSEISYQKAELANSDEFIPLSSEKKKQVRLSQDEGPPVKENGNYADSRYPYTEKDSHKGSKRELQEQEKVDGRERRKRQEKEVARQSSREALDDQRHGSKEALKTKPQKKEVLDREEQYKKLLNKSTWNEGQESQENRGDDERDGSNQRLQKKKQKKEENIRHVGPDGKKYRVSEKDGGEGEGKRRYYYRTKNKSQYESPPKDDEDVVGSPERPKHRPPKYQQNQRDSEGSLESLGRVRSPPKYGAPPKQPDESYDGRPPYDPERQDDPPRRRPPRYSDEPIDVIERRYEAPVERNPDPYEVPERHGDYGQERQRYGSREYDERYYDERNQSYNDYDYDGHDYVEAPPYVDTRYEDGYISSEV